jgi:SM-20-related protein
MLNPALNASDFTQQFAEQRLIRIDNIFKAEEADKIHHCLAKQVPWNIHWYDHSREGSAKSCAMTQKSYQQLTNEQRMALHQQVVQSAATGYQYLYNGFDLIKAHREQIAPELYIHNVMAYLASDELFNFIQTVTGDSDINQVDGHATRFIRGHFLKKHVDSSPFEHRRFAYVLGFTPEWQTDWGGLTIFMDEQLKPTCSLLPEFNSLTLFEVPINHCVTQVAGYVPAQRLSITGWFTIATAK